MLSTRRSCRLCSSSARRVAGEQSGTQASPERFRPPFVAMTRSSGYGASVSPISRSLTRGPVRVRGVDERDPELDGAKQHPPRLVDVAGLTDDPGPGDPHRPVAEAVDREVSAERERSGRACIWD